MKSSISLLIPNVKGLGAVIYYRGWFLQEKWAESEILKENLTGSEIFCLNLARSEID